MKRERETVCCVTNQCCDSPAADDPRSLRARCFACGEAVCTAPGCSTRAEYLDYGKHRVCAKCVEDRLGDHPTMLLAWRKIQRELARALGVPYEVIAERWEACAGHRYERVKAAAG